MTTTELKQKFPLTWKEIENGWRPLEYPMNDEIDAYQLRFYFDSVELIIIIAYDVYDEPEYWGDIVNINGNYIQDTESFRTRQEAETACILKCFEIREKQLNGRIC